MLPALAIGLMVIAAQEPTSPYQLPIGKNGSWLLTPGRMTEMASLKAATADDVAKAARGKQFVFLGEQHATTPHQQMQASIIEALAKSGRKVVIGLEMLQRPVQPVLDEWAKGEMSDDDLLTKLDWKKQWGYGFAYYRPVFDVARKYKMPILGLNVPREWVSAVGKAGFAGLSPEAKSKLPNDMELTNKDHRSVFDAMMGGHPGMSADAMNNVYAAQVLWDESMADTIVKHMKEHRPSGNTVYVVIAGSGHMLYGQGINYRLKRRGFGDGVNVAMLSSDEPIRVANGVADFVYVTMEKEGQRQK